MRRFALMFTPALAPGMHWRLRRHWRQECTGVCAGFPPKNSAKTETLFSNRKITLFLDIGNDAGHFIISVIIPVFKRSVALKIWIALSPQILYPKNNICCLVAFLLKVPGTSTNFTTNSQGFLLVAGVVSCCALAPRQHPIVLCLAPRQHPNTDPQRYAAIFGVVPGTSPDFAIKREKPASCGFSRF